MNVVKEFGHGLKVVAVDAERAIVDAVEFLPKAEKVLASAIKDQPAIKDAVLTLVKRASGVIGDTATAAAAKGINLAQDAKALSLTLKRSSVISNPLSSPWSSRYITRSRQTFSS